MGLSATDKQELQGAIQAISILAGMKTAGFAMSEFVRRPCEHGSFEQNHKPFGAIPYVGVCPGGADINVETIWWCRRLQAERQEVLCRVNGHDISKCGPRLLSDRLEEQQ